MSNVKYRRRNKFYFRNADGTLDDKIIFEKDGETLMATGYYVPFYENMSEEEIKEYESSLPLRF